MDNLGTLADQLADGDIIDFGGVPNEVNALLQQGVACYYDDRPKADGIFRQALAMAPDCLPVYFCLYKIHTYQSHLDAAMAVAESGLAEACRQAGWPADWRQWGAGVPQQGPGRFAAYTLKAMAFIHLRRNEAPQARALLHKLAQMGSDEGLGHGVVADIAAAMEGA